ncbi:hypothetical protein [Nonomuraea typhae]|uniref:hypothetical protein n=1 Tax=Nonomuraea typhae TaxID=2603600 RepID=UPI0012F7DF0A|nr:hypothetical protein [Nonomuraea typhae]
MPADQPGLWDLPEVRPATPTRPPRPRIHASAPRRAKTQRERDCDPRCLVCGHPEGRGLCTPRCAVVCVHAAQPYRAEVCIATVHVTAQLAVGLPGARPGRHLAVVDPCPRCGQRHAHAERYGRAWRLAPCGQPYIVHLPRPAAPGPAAIDEPPPAGRQTTTTRGAALARQALTRTEGVA